MDKQLKSSMEQYIKAEENFREVCSNMIVKGCEKVSKKFPKRKMKLLSGNGDCKLYIQGHLNHLECEYIIDVSDGSHMIKYSNGAYYYMPNALEDYIDSFIPQEWKDVLEAEIESILTYLSMGYDTEITFLNGEIIG